MSQKKTESQVYELETVDEEWRLNALRALIDPTIDREGDLFESQSELVSLNDIFKCQGPATDSQVVESYIMLHEGIEKEFEFGSVKNDLTLIVKRQKLTFNDKECVVFNF